MGLIMKDKYKDWDNLDDEEEDEPVRETIKESLMPRNKYNLPIDERFQKTTKGLFYEHRFQTTVDIPAPYTLRNDDFERDGHVYKSMYQIYMHCDSEYEAAIQILGSYSHWNKLKRCSWFHDHIERWENERNIRDEAIARSILVKLAEAGNVTAARTLYQNSKATKKEMGRPNKGGKRQESLGTDELDEMFSRGKEADGD